MARKKKVKLGPGMAGGLAKSKTNRPIAKAAKSTGKIRDISKAGSQASGLLNKGSAAASSGPTSASRFTTNSGSPHPLGKGLLKGPSARKGRMKVGRAKRI